MNVSIRSCRLCGICILDLDFDWLTHSVTHTLACSLIHTLTFTHAHPFTHSLTHLRRCSMYHTTPPWKYNIILSSQICHWLTLNIQYQGYKSMTLDTLLARWNQSISSHHTSLNYISISSSDLCLDLSSDTFRIGFPAFVCITCQFVSVKSVLLESFNLI